MITSRKHAAKLYIKGHETPSYFDRIGIEIEGLWTDLTTATERAIEITGNEGVEDCSVRCDEGWCEICFNDQCDCEEGEEGESVELTCNGCNLTRWEFQTRPGTLEQSLRQLVDLYPDEVNGSCGMHVHFSFAQPTEISCFNQKEFYTYLFDKMEAFGREYCSDYRPFWARLRDDAEYARRNTRDDYLENPHDNSRYKWINFQSFTKHKTLEVRLLPMFTEADVACRAVVALTSTLSNWLNWEVNDMLKKYNRNFLKESTIPINPTKVKQTVGLKLAKTLPPIKPGRQRILYKDVQEYMKNMSGKKP